MLGLADGQPVVLSPLEGNASALVLEAGDLPAQGVETGAELRMSSTDYPGSRRRSVQVLGIDEEDIVLRGRFRDVWGSVQGHAAAQWATLRAMFVAQPLVELSWGELVVRRGFVTKIRPTYISEGAIDYEITFHVVEADEALVITQAFDPPTPLPYDFFDLLDDVADLIEDALDATATASALVQLAA